MNSTLSKLVLISLLFIGLLSPAFSQEMSKQDYLEKSRENRKTGFILLGGGAVMVVSGIVIVMNNVRGEQRQDCRYGWGNYGTYRSRSNAYQFGFISGGRKQ
ncbi:hypothetical protein [Algoriphagus sp. CAU 1675]|uniref:hypothetical protein n=1 Tax=Algoriphagus sp. CAU 1675 TaxID=3032597 RepID=UPI0023D987EF|nr:hypothetical protein [Algoriphagus sp. CAU 1675]MDF2157594.1 hypothetical protein [Algoriphagus sp. CAU 1675]